MNTLADLVDVDPNVTSIPALVASPGADGKISLREAVAAAASSGDTINFDSSLNGGTITLDRAFQGEIAFGKSLTIDAGGLPNGIIIDADDPTAGHTGTGIRVFNITDPSGGTVPPLVTLVGLTLRGGDVGGISPQGGAVYSEARLVIRNSSIQGSEADLGGAIFLAVAGGGSTPREVLRIENSVIQGNFASSSGGGVAIVSGSFGSPTSDTAVINGTTFSDNRTNFGNGGGVYAELAGSSTFGPQLTISASTLALNESHNGGGIHVTLDGRAELLVSGSLIDANDASGDGAGVFVQANSGAQLRLDGVTLDGNEALGRGGGVHANLSDQAVAELIDSTFVQNDSSDDGGGGFATLLSNSTLLVQDSLFDTNFAADNGGAMAVELNASTAEFARTIVQTNLAAGAGGGLHATIASDSAMTIAESLITGNTAQGGGFFGEYGGGGVFAAIAEEAELLVEDSAISANIAAEGGGLRVNMPGFGHYSATNSKFTLSRSTVGGNRAVNRGGGLLLLSGAGGETVIQDSTITGNDAGIVLGGSPGAFTAANSGGGVYAYLFSGDDSIDQMNPAHTANEFARFTIAGSTVDNNAAGQHGGGLYLRAKRQDYTDAVNTDISLYNTTISGNTAGLTDDPTTSTPDDAVTGEGGGVHLTIFHLNVVPNHEVETVDVRFNNVTITDNTATVGGGVFSFVPDQVDDPPQSFQSMVDARFQNTIVSGNRTHESVPNNVWGSVNVAETVFNLFGLASSNTIFDHVTRSVTALRTDVPGGNRFNNDPKLSELANFGGPTRTHAILPSVTVHGLG